MSGLGWVIPNGIVAPGNVFPGARGPDERIHQAGQVAAVGWFLGRGRGGRNRSQGEHQGGRCTCREQR